MQLCLSPFFYLSRISLVFKNNPYVSFFIKECAAEIMLIKLECNYGLERLFHSQNRIVVDKCALT